MFCARQGASPKAGLSQADAAQLEDRALKMRKAMGENLADDVAGETVDAKQRRLNLIKCVLLRNQRLYCSSHPQGFHAAWHPCGATEKCI